MKKTKALALILIGVLFGSLLIGLATNSSFNPSNWGYDDNRYVPPGCCQGPQNFTSNGEKIYFTGINEDGERIPFNNGPQWLRVQGGSCINCHGRNGEGGFQPMMCNVETSSVSFQHLTEHGMNEEDIKNAITKGIEPNGEELSYCMPRWQMTQNDINDIIEHLKTFD